MSFWWREVAGWALVLLGLLAFGVCYLFLLEGQHPIEAGLAVPIGVFIFRGGIHLLKVAVAARICTEAAAEVTRRGGGEVVRR
jgi:hypothetical protein